MLGSPHTRACRRRHAKDRVGFGFEAGCVYISFCSTTNHKEVISFVLGDRSFYLGRRIAKNSKHHYEGNKMS